MARRDGEEGASVVDESARAVEARRLGDRGAPPEDRVGGVEEPPRRTHVDARVEARERGDLTGVDRFVDGEEHEVEAGRGAERLEQRTKVLGVLRSHRDVVPRVGAVALEGRPMVIPAYAGMDRHDQTVVNAHPRHLEEHVPAEQACSRGVQVPRHRPSEELLRSGGIEIHGERLQHAVISRHRARRHEVRATRSEGCQVAGERRLLAGRREESRDVRGERGRVRIDVGVGAEGRQHPPRE